MGVNPIHAALLTPYVQTLIRIKARQLTRKPGFNRSEREDLEQDLAAHILKQCHHFDPARGCANTFIARIVDSAVAMMLRDRGRMKRAAGFRPRSLEEVMFHRKKGPGSLEKLLDEADGCRRTGRDTTSGQARAELASDMRRAFSKLSPPLQELAARLIDAPEAAIARDLGISRRKVRDAVEMIQTHLQKAGLTET